jgi:hypothetical protein
MLHQKEARPADGFMLADGAAAGAGETIPLFEDEAAMLAHRGNDLETQARSGGPEDMG